MSETFDFISPPRPWSKRKRRIFAISISLIVFVSIIGVGQLVFWLHNAPVTVVTDEDGPPPYRWGWADSLSCQAIAFNISTAGTLRTNWTANPPGTLELVSTSSLGHPVSIYGNCSGVRVNSAPNWESPPNVSGGDMAAQVNEGDYTLIFSPSGSGGTIFGTPLILTPAMWAW